MPHSQAPFCLCTPRRISIPPEGTFGRLRYLLGGRRPSQTAHLTLSLCRIHGNKLGPKSGKGGIPRAPPPAPEGELHWLPPILCIPPQSPRPGCSKAPRGLSVPPRVVRVFTDTTVSPGPPPRQRRSRYAFRAGRNLPDKEFRYLRTVRVTAGVYPGFGARALPGRKPGEPVPLTFGHWPGVGPYTSPFGLAGTCVFVKQSPRPLICDPLGLLGRKVRSPYWGSPSPEVTGTFCRVPWRGFSRAPVDTLLAHLWRFPVRSPALRAALSGGLGKGFSWLPWGTTSPRKGGSLPPSQPSHGKVDSTVAADDHRRVGSLGRVPHP